MPKKGFIHINFRNSKVWEEKQEWRWASKCQDDGLWLEQGEEMRKRSKVGSHRDRSPLSSASDPASCRTLPSWILTVVKLRFCTGLQIVCERVNFQASHLSGSERQEWAAAISFILDSIFSCKWQLFLYQAKCLFALELCFVLSWTRLTHRKCDLFLWSCRCMLVRVELFCLKSKFATNAVF